jgi:hypothetical protein
MFHWTDVGGAVIEVIEPKMTFASGMEEAETRVTLALQQWDYEEERRIINFNIWRAEFICQRFLATGKLVPDGFAQLELLQDIQARRERYLKTMGPRPIGSSASIFGQAQ